MLDICLLFLLLTLAPVKLLIYFNKSHFRFVSVDNTGILLTDHR